MRISEIGTYSAKCPCRRTAMSRRGALCSAPSAALASAPVPKPILLRLRSTETLALNSTYRIPRMDAVASDTGRSTMFPPLRPCALLKECNHPFFRKLCRFAGRVFQIESEDRMRLARSRLGVFRGEFDGFE